MRPPTLQAEFKKAEGNKAYAKKDYSAAIQFYSEAIELDPSNHVYYSNRSASFLEAGRFKEAKLDGERCIAMGPTFVQGLPTTGSLKASVLRSNGCSQVTSGRRTPNIF